ncbi:TonB-dependent receptor [Spirosoma sp. 209]|uniref:SusC/RagA family TonB-linked outer membrane protein n=1 Tax=Spirosoma sp. 209 TaxID=1955701 RepID=UPI00098D17B7|nr:TonB-dependent receptor [Spirosoma sp. 209]
MMNKLLLTGLLCLSAVVTTVAQALTVRGRIIDADRKGIPGVNVLVKGTSRGTTTTADGDFSLQADAKDRLVISYLGYATQEVAVNNQTQLEVTLAEDNKMLNEVVVVGYGETKRRDLVSSVASISGQEINEFKTGNAATAIQGKLPGVRVVTPSGGPGAQPTIYIRGVSSLQGGTSPLLVVDGVPIYSGGLNSINPNDIASLDVLKDASAAAIYGAKASGGVIVITTKRGKINSGRLDVDINVQAQQLQRPYQMASSDEYVQFQRLKNPSFFNPPPSGQSLTNNTDWWGAVIRPSSPVYNANISYTGGSNKSTYAATLGYFRQESQAQFGYWQRVNARFNGDFGVTDWLKFGVVFAPRLEDWKNYAVSDFLGLLGTDPTTAVRRGDLNHIPAADRSQYDLEWSGWGYPYARPSNNPVNYYLEMKRAQLGLNRVYGIQSNAYLEIKPAKGFTFTSKVGGNVDTYNYQNFSPKFYLDPQNFTNLVSASSSFNTNYSWSWFNTLGYANTFNGIHNLKALVGQEAQYIDGYYGSATRYSSQGTNDPLFNSIDNLVSDRSPEQINRQYPGTGGGTTDINRREAISSLLGRLEYNYDNKYYFTGNVRRDGNSKFTRANQYALFPSASVGWRLSQEGFLKNNKLVNDLFLKVRWGQRGNSNAIPPTATYDIAKVDWPYAFGGTTVYSTGPWLSGNPNLQWEVDEDFSIGLDATALDNKVSVNLEYFDNNARKLLLNAPIQLSYGTQYGWSNSQWLNAGALRNRGWEATINYGDKKGDFGYNASLIFSHVKTTVRQLYGTLAYLDGGGNDYREGERFGTISRTYAGGILGAFYGYKADGIFRNQEEVDAYRGPDGRPIQSDAKPGDLRFADVNGDGVINSDDRTIIGNPYPDLTANFNLRLSYKRFDLTADMYGVFGQDVFNTVKRYFTLGDYFSNVQAGSYNNVWRPDNQDAPNPNPNATAGNFQSSSYYVEKGSFVRGRNFVFGYNLPDNLIKGIRACRVYVGAQNLFTITNYTGVNPEVQSNSGNGTTPQLGIGIDHAQYPVSRNLQVGLNLSF